MNMHTTAGTVSDRRRNSVFAASAAKRDQGEFNHKAVKALTTNGIERSAIAALLGLSEATARRLQYTPCPAYDEERRDRENRRAPCTRFLSDADIAWEEIMQGTRGDMRATIQGFLEDLSSRRLTQGDVAKLLGISQQAVSRHVNNLFSARLRIQRQKSQWKVKTITNSTR
ncbi:winged helix-turn-helix domain-containing protein [Mesorhizobium sp. WSM4976]|uniref:winged helix-turn-helix domain-containing protein n=1 Tax=Mesorhizobium sp. WSM4976 TaxID=3038549 RepID=UPI0024169EAF|nr:winged helix-turn-helix domain-containing protein [Mesorhizobium sp. WSM4976]MDG4896492.1 winged helix-turn-helix domain-containing protein [Mesorhizobium sp. WSM4976]